MRKLQRDWLESSHFRQENAHKPNFFGPVGLGTTPGMSWGQTLCPRDKPSLSLGQSRGRRAAEKVYVSKVYVPFSLFRPRCLLPLGFSAISQKFRSRLPAWETLAISTRAGAACADAPPLRSLASAAVGRRPFSQHLDGSSKAFAAHMPHALRLSATFGPNMGHCLGWHICRAKLALKHILLTYEMSQKKFSEMCLQSEVGI